MNSLCRVALWVSSGVLLLGVMLGPSCSGMPGSGLEVFGGWLVVVLRKRA